MSAPSENMPIVVAAPRAKPMRLRHLPYFIGAAVAGDARRDVPFDGYILNILMQAATYAVAVFGLTVVLGLCGQINLAQAAFFGIGAYAVGLGTVGLPCQFWLCLAAGLRDRALPGALLGLSTLRLGGHYLAMVTISFQQIVTLVLVNWIWVTHGPDGVPTIGRPFCSSRPSRIWLSASPCWRWSAMSSGGSGHAARPRDARGARQRTRGRRGRHRCLPHQGHGLRDLRDAGRARRRPVRRRLRLYQPGPILLRRVDRVPDHGAARRRGLADRRCDRHRAADPDPGMAAVPEGIPGFISRSTARRHPDHASCPTASGDSSTIANGRLRAPPGARHGVRLLQLDPATRRRHRPRGQGLAKISAA